MANAALPKTCWIVSYSGETTELYTSHQTVFGITCRLHLSVLS